MVAEIKVVPPFDELAVTHPHPAHAGELHGSLSGGKPQRVTAMCPADDAPAGHLVTFDDDIFDVDAAGPGRRRGSSGRTG